MLSTRAYLDVDRSIRYRVVVGLPPRVDKLDWLLKQALERERFRGLQRVGESATRGVLFERHLFRMDSADRLRHSSRHCCHHTRSSRPAGESPVRRKSKCGAKFKCNTDVRSSLSTGAKEGRGAAERSDATLIRRALACSRQRESRVCA